ncbi:MAG: DUF4339 domain-containing protein [Gloeobacteraceae cyanobacterium ES-bin-144]|nr:DUF4339 domain-containing protein [Verrucomicrobiales bacterium]
MTEWFYARGGQQSGPVTMEQLAEMARSGGLHPTNDLVWTSTMKDWMPAGQVAGVFPMVNSPLASATGASNPYAASQSSLTEQPMDAGLGVDEIIHGSEPIDVGACVKRGFELTKREFGTIILVGLVYFGVSMGVGFVFGLLQGVYGVVAGQSGAAQSQTVPIALTVVTQLVTQVLSIFLQLGLCRVGLNLVSGKTASVGMLFGEGHKLLRTIGASIIFGFAVVIGLVLLVFPGIYIAIRYGQYMNAIVDRDLGIMDAFAYSSSITTNNRVSLFLLYLLCMAIIIAGMLACGVGLIFAAPVAWLGMMVSYRWMQYGHRAALDHPGTLTPMLRSPQI